MSKIGDATFVGASGKEYVFGAFPLGTTFKEIAGLYIFGKFVPAGLMGSGNTTPLYIGQTDNLERRISDHEKLACAKIHGFNCICAMVFNGTEAQRIDVETDLRHGNPTPCNDQ
jgi:hypothetical protein